MTKIILKKNRTQKDHSAKEKDILPVEEVLPFTGLMEVNVHFEKGEIIHIDYNFRKDKAAAVIKSLRKSGSRNDLPVLPPDNSPSSATELEENVFIKENKLLQKLRLEDILFAQAMGDYVSIYTIDRKITIHSNLKSLETKLPSTQFLRIHRSYMVSLSKIEVIEESTIYISSHPIPIGEAYRTKLMKLLKIIK